MPLNNKAVVTAAVGYVYIAPVGTPRPSPSDLAAADPRTFGAQALTLKVTGTPTTYKLTVGSSSTSSLPLNSDAGQVQAALEGLMGVGSGNVEVSGVSADDASGLTILVVGDLQGQTLTITGTATGGTSPSVDVTVAKAPLLWKQTGNTSRNDMPEFGYDGGDSEVKGTWQNEKLREVVSETPADYLTLFLQQFDTENFELYYGSNASNTPGVFGVEGGTPPPNEHAFLVIIVDGTAKIGFYAPKANVRRDDSIDMPVDDFSSLPIKATFLKHGGKNLFEWINEDLFV